MANRPIWIQKRQRETSKSGKKLGIPVSKEREAAGRNRQEEKNQVNKRWMNM